MSWRQIKFQKMAAEFDEASRDKRPCGGSSSNSTTGASSSEWSLSSSGSLSDLVNSFIESGGEGAATEDYTVEGDPAEEGVEDIPANKSSYESEREELLKLKRLLSRGGDQGRDEVVVRENRHDLEEDVMSIERRRLVIHLRRRGYDAGLCKSKWEKSSRHPAGTHDYIDVVNSHSRYIVEVFLAGQFEIARPTDHYTALLAAFPPVFVGRVEDLKQIVRVMGIAMRKSLKSQGLPVAPWRARGYMFAKWFGPYKRMTMITNVNVGADPSAAAWRERKWAVVVVVGFEQGCSKSLEGAKTETLALGVFNSNMRNCRVGFVRKSVGSKMRVGLLSAAFQGR